MAVQGKVDEEAKTIRYLPYFGGIFFRRSGYLVFSSTRQDGTDFAGEREPSGPVRGLESGREQGGAAKQQGVVACLSDQGFSSRKAR